MDAPATFKKAYFFFLDFVFTTLGLAAGFFEAVAVFFLADGLLPKMRMIIEGRTFEINSVVEVGRRELHEVSATEVLDE